MTNSNISDSPSRIKKIFLHFPPPKRKNCVKHLLLVFFFHISSWHSSFHIPKTTWHPPSTFTTTCTQIRTLLHILFSSAGVLEIPGVHLFLHQGFPIKLLSQSSLLPFWQLPAYICLNLSPLSRVQQVNEHSHFPALTSVCRQGESESSQKATSGIKNNMQ